jgi:hypothetical protein
VALRLHQFLDYVQTPPPPPTVVGADKVA